MHATLTCAALEAGKHVLCEARMVRMLGCHSWPMGSQAAAHGWARCLSRAAAMLASRALDV